MKNKKGIEGFTILIIFILLCIGFLFIVAVDSMFVKNESNKACKELGFERRIRLENGIDTCEDKFGDIYFVKLDCTSFKFYMSECSAKIIKVGEAWGSSEKTANGE